MLSTTNIHALHRTDRKVQGKAFGPGNGQCIGLQIGSHELTIFHQGDTLFLQRIRAEIDAAVALAMELEVEDAK